MNQEQIQKLVELKKKGYSILIASGYVDTFVHQIYEDEVEDGSIQWCYDSQVYGGAELRKIPYSKVSVYKQIHNWETQD